VVYKMLSITTNLVSHTQIQVLPETKQVNAANEIAAASATDEVKPAVSVTISGAAMKASTTAKNANSDIDDSGLADNVKNLLKMIRNIKKQIAEKQAEMAAVMADKSLSPEQARAKLSGLQAALGGLQASMISAQASLAKVMKGMSASDAMTTASLAMK